MKNKCKYLMLSLLVLVLACGQVGMAANQGEEPLVTMMLFETDLREALSEISLQTGISIIPDQTVGGLVTVDLQDVPLEKALQMILIGGGYTFKKMDGYYLIGLPDPMSMTFGELSEIEVIELKHVTAQKIIEMVPTFLKSYIQGARDGKLITLNAPRRELERLKDLIEKIDKPRKQIEVKVVVTQVNANKVRELGVNLLSYDHSENRAEITSNTLGMSLDGNLLVLETDVYGSLLAKLRLLEEEQEARIEADPRVLLADGSTAELFIGEQQIILLDANENSTSRLEEIETGVGLRVTASIIGDEEIILEIAPKVSHYLGRNANSHIIKESSVLTTLQLKNEQTVVLAGMSIHDESIQTSRVPILGDIPILRWLFKNEKLIKSDQELLVFVTPVIR